MRDYEMLAAAIRRGESVRWGDGPDPEVITDEGRLKQVYPATSATPAPTAEEKARAALSRAGFDTPEKIATASDDDLLKIDGVTKAGLAKIRATG